MSHTLKSQTTLRPGPALNAACRRLNLKAPTTQRVRFYDGNHVTGLAVKLPGWRYPVVIGEDGEVTYDNMNGHWGKQSELDRLTQMYTVEGVRMTTPATDTVQEQAMGDGRIRLRVTVAA